MKSLETFSGLQEVLQPASGGVVGVGNNIYHSLGLLEIMPEARAVCNDEDTLLPVLQKKGYNIFCLEQSLGQKNTVFRNTANLLSHERVLKYLQNSNSQQPYLYIAKPSRKIEVLTQKNKWEVLGASSRANRFFESKVAFSRFLQKTDFPTYPREILFISEDNLTQVGSKFGWPLVIQFDRGVAGAGTFFVKKEDVSAFVKKHKSRQAVSSPFVEGKTVTLNGVVLKDGVVIGAPFLQISNETKLNKNESGTCGNDYGCDLGLSQKEMQVIFDTSHSLGEKMREFGFRGMFGLDFLVGDKVLLVEVNARPPASVPTFTFLEKIKDEVPLLGLHIADFLGIDLPLSCKDLSWQKMNAEHSGSKLILRNPKSETVELKRELAAGVYQFGKKLKFLSSDYSFFNLTGEDNFLLWTAGKGKNVNENMEIATLIFPNSVTTNGKLGSDFIDITQGVKKALGF